MASWGKRESEWAEWAEVMPRSQRGMDTFEHDLINGGEALSFLQQGNGTKRAVLCPLE